MTLSGPLAVPPAMLTDFESGSRLEWLETDGRGGYASSSAIAANTRRYHGLLVVAQSPPTERIVLLSRLEETVVTAVGRRHELAANVYPGVVHPRGYRDLEEFRLDPWPIWRYRIGSLTLTKTLFLAREAGAVVISYRLDGGDAALELRPLIAGRDFHALVRENDIVARTAEVACGMITYRPYPGIPTLVLTHDGGEWLDTGSWYRHTLYPRETERGLDDREDLYNPGTLSVALADGREWRVACATAAVPLVGVEAWAAAERERRADAVERGRRAACDDPDLVELGGRLGTAAEAFIVERGPDRSIIAGYPWFADWGRDAMISLPGFCLTLGRPEIAAAVLRAFARHLKDGLIPNRFPDYGGIVPADHYNAADASLWFVEAVAALGEAGGEVEEFWPAVREIIGAYRTGTHFGIAMAADGLVRQGIEGVQLTWMDAKVDAWVVTPRIGRAVEINALWYNALRRAAGIARSLSDDPRPYTSLADRVRMAFSDFWFAGGGYLYDVIDDLGRPDDSLRPNQIFAVALHHSPLDHHRARAVVDVVERELLVPMGVRTLAPGDPGYHGHYGGTQRERDAAYHCGTAWPWLLGPFITAYLRVHRGAPAARTRVLEWLESVRAHLSRQGLGQIAEVVAGDPPHEPGGCIAQAWSCAEILRVLPLVASAGGGPRRDTPGR